MKSQCFFGIIKINKTYKADTGSTTAYFVLYKYNDDYDAFDPNSIEYEKYSDVSEKDAAEFALCYSEAVRNRDYQDYGRNNGGRLWS